MWLRNFVTIFILSFNIVNGRVLEQTVSDDDHRMHPLFNFKSEQRLHKRAMPPLRFDASIPEEKTSDYWNGIAQNILDKQLETKTKLNTNLAKNIIMFLGDGMSISTITAARVYLGGEERQLNFEKFPYAGLSKTYCANAQVADSACTATAYLGGVKANYGTLGVTAAVELNDCQAQNITEYHVSSIAEWAQEQGMATGLITTTSVTHASPAGIYAHAANRDWENDAEVLKSHKNPKVCNDIATQLVHGKVGRNLSIILGGGQEHFLPRNTKPGKRVDGRNLIEEWQKINGPNARYVTTLDELYVVPNTTEKIIIIFGINNGQLAADQLPYATLSYANGPGFENNILKHSPGFKRKNLLETNMKHKDYKFPSIVPLESETHGGDDVAVFASGPFAHLFTGVYEQNFIPHGMAYAACLGTKKTACSDGLHLGRRY